MCVLGASLVAQIIKNLPAMWETWVRSLGQEDPLVKGMATHSSILAWRSPWTEKPGRLQSRGSQRFGHDWATFTLTLARFFALLSHCRSKNILQSSAYRPLVASHLQNDLAPCYHSVSNPFPLPISPAASATLTSWLFPKQAKDAPASVPLTLLSLFMESSSPK